MQNNADVVEAFLGDKARKFRSGDSLTLPDIGQVYTVLDQRFYRKRVRGKVLPYLEMESDCPVCGEPFVFTRDVHEWRKGLSLVRTCLEHRGQWRSPVKGCWLSQEKRDDLEYRRRLAALRVRRKGARVKSVGKIDRLLLETFLDLQLVEGFVYLDDLHAEAISRLPKPANRDTRRQVVVRALKRGNLLRAKGGWLEIVDQSSRRG